MKQVVQRDFKESGLCSIVFWSTHWCVHPTANGVFCKVAKGTALTS